MNQLKDHQWIAVKNFVQQYMQPAEKVLAPPQFKHDLPNLHIYTFAAEISADQFEWVLLHKGQLQLIDSAFLEQALELLRPVFANEVFVVLTSRSDVPAAVEAVHLQTLLQQVAPQRSLPAPPFSLPQALLRRFKQFGKPSQADDPRLDRIASQLNTVLDRLTELERTSKKLSQSRVLKLTRTADLSLDELRAGCRNACQTAYLGDNTILCRILATHLLYGDTRDVGIVPHLCLNGFWEPWVTLTMIRTIRPGWHCLDVGANHGYYTVVMSSIVGSSGRVVALEPNPRLVELLRKTLDSNSFSDQAVAMDKAVSDRAGEMVQFVVPQGRTGHASLRSHASATDQVLQVETVTVDQLTAEWPQVNLIKIDVEGAEEAVWRGMRETVRRNKDIVIVMEFGASRYPNSRAFLEEILAEGFILRYIDFDTYSKEISIDRCLTERKGTHWELFLSRS